jgi:Tol biopolymer transport system component
MRPYIYIILIALTITSCFGKKQESRNNVYRPEFDISMDNRNIVCSYYENDKASIYQIDITNDQKTKICSTTEYSLIKPVYSPDNKQIACLSESLSDNLKGKICLIDINSKNLIDLTNDSLLILECIYNHTGKSLFFTAAKRYGNYSPIASKAAHEIDIYNINIATKRIRQITNFNSYDLHGLSITKNGDSLLFRLTAKDYDGLYLMDLNSKRLSQISALNDLRVAKKATAYEYYDAVLSRDNSKISFSEPYELYIMDRRTKTSKLIFRNEANLVNVGEAKFFNSANFLLISLPTNNNVENSRGDNYGFYILNTQTNELNTIDQ